MKFQKDLKNDRCAEMNLEKSSVAYCHYLGGLKLYKIFKSCKRLIYIL